MCPCVRACVHVWTRYTRAITRTDAQAFLAEHLAKDVTIGSTAALVPDADVEEYVDLLLKSSVLANTSLPFGVGRCMLLAAECSMHHTHRTHRTHRMRRMYAARNMHVCCIHDAYMLHT